MSGVTPSRRVAFRVVRRVFEDGAYADRALHGEAKGLEPRDRAFAMQLAFGTVQRRATLDHFIAQLARPVDQLDAETVAALRLGLYQLHFLGGVGQHAAVGESVELAKAGKGAGFKLVNAVLRRAARDGLELPEDDTPAGAALAHSYPEWLVQLWWDVYGAEQTRALLTRGNQPSELAIRVNTLVTDDVDLENARRDPELPEARIIDGPFDVHGHPLWQQGAITAQSRASMLVARALDPQPGERILDLCAAPGGKTTHLAALTNNEAEIVAVERHPGRAEALKKTCHRMKARVSVVVKDAEEITGGGFDRVLVDPPCSGLGTIQGHPDLRWRATPDSIAALTTMQAAILQAGRNALKPGGTLVYSTCTLTAKENEEIVRAAGMTIAAERHLLPHRDNTEGFYIARLSA